MPAVLYPAPRRAEFLSPRETLRLPARGTILTAAPVGVVRQAAARRVQTGLAALGLNWDVAATPLGRPYGGPGVIRLATEAVDLAVHGPESYRLSVTADGVLLTGGGDAGLLYAAVTLDQLLREHGGLLPVGEVQDWPEFPVRGYLYDVSRDRVPSMDTLRQIVDDCADLKINQLQLYTEHTFAYHGHEEVWGDASPITAQDIVELDRYCAERNVELVPNQNTLGHLHKWLKHASYAHLAENHPYRRIQLSEGVMDGGAPFWGDVPYSICPTDEAAVGFVLGLLDELMPNFASTTVNVCLDEPFDLTLGRTAAASGARPAEVYLQHVRRIHDHLAERGRAMQMWGDYAAVDREVLDGLPRDIVVIDWGYWASHPFEDRAAQLAAAGLPFLLATGTNSWCTLGGKLAEMQAHMRRATAAALAHGARGIVVTDWGWFQHGTYQTFPISYPGLVFGAGQMWSPQQSDPLPLRDALSTLLRDSSGALADCLLELASILPGTRPDRIKESSPLFWALRRELDRIAAEQAASPDELRAALGSLARGGEVLAGQRSTRPDAAWLVGELDVTIGLLRHAVERSLLAVEPSTPEVCAELAADLHRLLDRFGRVWLQRYRIGGLAGTLDGLAALARGYAGSAAGGAR